MAVEEVTVPAVGESISEGTLNRWLKPDGAYVKVDEPLYELGTDKATQEIAAPVAGVLEDPGAGGRDGRSRRGGGDDRHEREGTGGRASEPQTRCSGVGQPSPSASKSSETADEQETPAGRFPPPPRRACWPKPTSSPAT